MFVACVVVSVALAAVASLSGALKLAHNPGIVEGITGLGVPLGWFPWLATAEIAGAAGIVVGLAWAPLGVAAAAGLVAYFVGAVITHLRARDFQGVSSPAPLLVFAIAALALRAMTI